MDFTGTKIPKLRGSNNYDIWAIRIQAVLTEKGYYSVFSGELTAGSPEYKGASLKAAALIRLTLEDSPLIQTQYIEDAKALWDQLKTLYEPKGFNSEFLICRELFSTTLAKCGNSIESYLTKIRRYTDQLSAKGLPIPPKVIAAYTLSNLTPDYESTVAIISQTIRTAGETIDLLALFGNLIDESRRLKYRDNDTEMALPLRDKPKNKCSFCSKIGHTEQKCWLKHPELKSKNRLSKPKKDKQSNKETDNDQELALVLRLTGSQTGSQSEQPNIWYLDSGATRHICSNKNLFTGIETCNITLHWGNAGSIQAKGIGSIRLKFTSTGQVVTINNCLYVPEIGLNLLSLGQLLEKGLNITSRERDTTLAKDNRIIAKGVNSGNLTLFYTESIEQVLTTITRQTWHERMGHIGSKALEQLPKTTQGCDLTGEMDTCEICIQSKATAKISREPSQRASKYLEVVHSDIWGPIKPLTWSKGRYFISFIDDYSRWAEVALLTGKDNTYTEFLNWINREERQTDYNLKRFHTDNAKEYKAQQLEQLIKDKGIIHTYSAPYAHEQNGLAEIFNRTILSKVRAMLLQSQVSHRYWGEALISAVYIYNRTPHSGLNGFITPYEARYSKPPDISNIKIWGSKAYKRLPLEGLNKLQPRATLGVIIGYGPNQYKITDISTHKTSWVRDAYILEDEYLQSTEKEILQDTTTETSDETWYNSFKQQLEEASEDYALIATPEPLDYQQAISSPESEEWTKAMKAEITELQAKETWDLVPLPPEKKALKGRWVFKLKELPDKNSLYKARWVAKGFQQKPGVDFTETFANTVNPTTYRLILAIAAYKDWEIQQWDVKSAYPNAKLHDEVYIQQPTGFETTGKETLVCHLRKALYGLKQAAREWQQFLRELLSKYNLTPLKSDQGVFISSTETLLVITYVDDLLVISDNTTKIKELYHKLNSTITLKNLGPVKTFLGIDISRNRQLRAITLSQGNYTSKILSNFGYTISDTVKPLVPLGKEIAPIQETPDDNLVKEYQRQIGSIMYLMTKTRPDLAYPIGLCARFMAKPGPEHFKALLKIWKYLSNTWNLSLTYQSDSQEVITYCDADWGGDITTRRSTTGYVTLYRGSTISWNSKLQHTVALSSCEAEFMALKEAIKEQLFIQSLLNELQPAIQEKITNNLIYTDSLSAIELAKNPLHHSRTKHIDIQYNFIREKYQQGISKLTYIPTQKQIADGLTKSIDQQKWLRLVNNLGLQQLPPLSQV